MQTTIQHFKINIPADNAEYPLTDAKLDPRSKKVIGFWIVSKRIDQVDLRGTFKMEIDGKEVFPEGTDTKILTTNAMVPVKDKMYLFKNSAGALTPLDAGSHLLNIRYKSSNNALAAFAAHDVTFSFILES